MASILDAVSMKGYDSDCNYDRLEMIGDTVFKLLSTLEIFSQNKSLSENEMHIKRIRIINNINLYR